MMYKSHEPIRCNFIISIYLYIGKRVWLSKIELLQTVRSTNKLFLDMA